MGPLRGPLLFSLAPTRLNPLLHHINSQIYLLGIFAHVQKRTYMLLFYKALVLASANAILGIVDNILDNNPTTYYNGQLRSW